MKMIMKMMMTMLTMLTMMPARNLIDINLWPQLVSQNNPIPSRTWFFICLYDDHPHLHSNHDGHDNHDNDDDDHHHNHNINHNPQLGMLTNLEVF